MAVVMASAAVVTHAPANAVTSLVHAPDTAAIAAEFEKQCADGTFSGVVVIRVREQEVFNRACGQADMINGIANTRATRFKIYSTSKFITALTVMRMVELGKIRLDAPINRYIADAPPAWSLVTIRTLLNHTSGIDDLTVQLVKHFHSDGPTAMSATLTSLTPDQSALKSPPGTTFKYNNFGFELLAAAAARAGGKPFADLVGEHVFKPAGMATASIEQPNVEMGHPVAVSEPGLASGYNGAPGKLELANNWAFIQLGAGAVRASVDDFLALDSTLRAGKVVRAETLQEMLRSPVAAENADEAAPRFGLGVIVTTQDGVTMHGHTGGTNGYISDFERYPDDDAVLIALTNRGFVKTKWLREGVAKMLKAAR